MAGSSQAAFVSPPTPNYRSQSGRFLHITLNGVPVGGIQNYTFTESYGTHWMGEVGSDYKDPEFQMRQVQGSCERLAINLHKFRDLIEGADSSKINIDFRDYKFTLIENYAEAYGRIQPTPAGQVVPGQLSSLNAPISETLYNVMFTDLTARQSDITVLRRESVNFIGTSINVDTNTQMESIFNS